MRIGTRLRCAVEEYWRKGAALREHVAKAGPGGPVDVLQALRVTRVCNVLYQKDKTEATR